jgi:hypothetical protein
MRVDAERYRWLRNRNLDAIKNGGVFAGMTPSNVVLNGEDLDLEIDAAMLTPNAVLSGAATEPTTECGASPRPPRTRG